MNWNKLIGIDISTKKIKKYIYSEIGERKEESYEEIKDNIKKKYEYIEDEDELKEIYNVFNYKKIALDSISPENLTVGMISIISTLVAILAIGISMEISNMQFKGQDYKFFINSYRFIFFLLIILTGSIALLSHRIKDKSRKMVYYNIEIEVLGRLLDSEKNDS